MLSFAHASRERHLGPFALLGEAQRPAALLPFGVPGALRDVGDAKPSPFLLSLWQGTTVLC